MQPDGSETGQLVVLNGYASTNPIVTGHQSHLVYHKVVHKAGYYFLYINDLDINIISKMSKFADECKLCHRARNPDDILELQKFINKLVEWANKWQISFNVDKCSVMHIGHNNMQSNYTISNQQLPTTDQKRDLGIIITTDLKWQKHIEKRSKTAHRVFGFISRNFRYKNKELILPLYKSLVRPHLEHAVQFWSPHLFTKWRRYREEQQR